MEKMVSSGVGVLINRLGSTVPTIEKWFPLPSDPPKRFKTPLYPHHTDILFMKAIHDLAGRKINEQTLTRIPTFARLKSNQREILSTCSIREAFLELEPQFKDYPDVIETFIRISSRYIDPFPVFELDLIYGAADLYCGTTLVEMKAYSVMTPHDLLMARNQILVYACLATFGPSKLNVNQIELVNCLTGEIWSWDWEAFLRHEGERFYWTLIMPIISNGDISNHEITELVNLYELNPPGVLILAKTIQNKASQTEHQLKRRINQLEEQVRQEVLARDNLAAKYKALATHVPEQTKEVHWLDYMEDFVL